MTTSSVIDAQQLFARPESLSALFHMVNRLLPDRQVVLSVPPTTPAREALRMMREHGYSQLPVREGDSVLGLFTFRAFALEAAQNEGKKADLAALPVEEFLEHEHVNYARLQDEFRGLIETLDQHGAVVVSGQDDLVAILTPMDVLRYLYAIANAFVLIEEIELSLRTLIRFAITDQDTFARCIGTVLLSKYGPDELPQRLEDMSFDDYIALVRDGRTWPLLEPAFGGIRQRAQGRLEPVRELRNDVFHFRRELSVEDHELLTACRGWLLRCCRKVEARRGSR